MLSENLFRLTIMMSFENEISARLKKQGYKLTSQRLAVLHAMASGEGHMTPEAVYDKVRQVQPGVGLVTIYRTLNMLAGLGLICEVHVGDSCRSFAVSSAGHHDHLVCSQCGRVVNFTGCDLGNLESRLSSETGFAIGSHLLEFLGRCPSCRNCNTDQ